MKAALNTRQILAIIVFITTFSCQKELSLENHIAEGTLRDSSGICFSNTVKGTFYNGVTPGTDTTYVEIKVNVSKTGTYTISTDLQNGFSFADFGTFNNTGINIIRLKSTGTPITNVPTNFMIRFDSSICSLMINIQDSALLNQHVVSDTLPLYNWKFTDTKRELTYRGRFENNYILPFGSFNVLVLSTRDAKAPGDSAFTMNIRLPDGIISVGTYTTDVPPTGIVFRTFSDACVNCAGGGLIPISSGVLVTVKINSYDPITKIVEGSFSGTTIDWFDAVAAIKDGQFSAVVR
ncbi:MAG: hypothetical protein ABIO76_09640 [Ginsengibacter sp.]